MDHPDNEYYHFLNVPRDASEEQVSAHRYYPNF